MSAAADPIFARMLAALNNNRALAVAVDGLVAWEWLVTFSQEVKIWRADLSFFNVLVILLRYLTITHAIILTCVGSWSWSAKACDRIILCLPYMPMFILLGSSTVVTARVYAIYNRNKVLLFFLCAYLTAQVAIQSWIPHTLTAMPLPPDFPGNACFPNASKGVSWYWLFWTLPMIFDTIVLVLTMYKTFRYWRTPGSSSIFQILIRDQAVFFVLTFAINLSNMMYYATHAHSNPVFLAPLTASIQSIAACRIVFNLRSCSRDSVSKVSVQTVSSVKAPSSFPLGPVSPPSFSKRPRSQTAIYSVTTSRVEGESSSVGRDLHDTDSAIMDEKMSDSGDDSARFPGVKVDITVETHKDDF